MAQRRVKRTYYILNDSSFHTPNLQALLGGSEGHSFHVSSSTGLADHEAPVLAGLGELILVEELLCGILGSVDALYDSPGKY